MGLKMGTTYNCKRYLRGRVDCNSVDFMAARSVGEAGGQEMAQNFNSMIIGFTRNE